MATFPQTLRQIGTNPVAQAELSHQRRSASAHTRWKRFPAIFGLMLGGGVLSYLALRLSPQLAPLLSVPLYELDTLLRGWFDTITILLSALIMLHHLAFSTAALQLAAASIAREKQGRTWESLVLTGVDARQIVYGKWGATMHALWDAYRPLLLLRFAAAIWMSLAGGIASAAGISSLPLFEISLIGIITAIFPLCYATFMVALGLLASLLVTRETAAIRIASGLRFCAILVSLGFAAPFFVLTFSDFNPALISLVLGLFVTPLDGGMLTLISMISNRGAVSPHYLLGLLLCILLYAALTWGVLRLAQALTVRQRALPPKSG
ncbi:MAG: hypothetical protein ABI835_10760 [Chloroflexota bacterium]